MLEHPALMNDDLEQHLLRQFPRVSPDTVDHVIEAHYHEFDGRPLRDYVAVVVEHAAKSDLLAMSQ